MKIAFGVLREGRFRQLYLARAFSLLGDGIVPVALAFAVLSIERSATALGVVLAAQAVPRVVFMLVGGVIADRLPRRLVMICSDLLRFGTQALAAALLISDQAQLWQLAALMAIYGGASAFFLPASTGLLPQLVRRGQLQQANALLSLTDSAFGLLGPAIAGLLVASVGAGWAFAVDAATFILSAVFLLRIGDLGKTAAIAGSFISQLGAGWREVRSRTWLWMDGVFSALGNALTVAPIFVLGPVVAKESLGGATSWAVIAASFGGGAILGSIVALRIRPNRPLLLAWALLALFSLPPALLAFPAPTIAIAAGALLAGVSLNIANTLFETALQEHVPAEAISRAASFSWLLALLLQPIGFALVGPVAEAVGIRTTLAAAAVWSLLSSAIALSVPGVRDLRRQADPDPDPGRPSSDGPVPP